MNPEWSEYHDPAMLYASVRDLLDEARQVAQTQQRMYNRLSTFARSCADEEFASVEEITAAARELLWMLREVLAMSESGVA